MAQQAVPAGDARLGRAVPVPSGETVHGVVLLLPNCRPVSTRRQSPLAAAAVLRLARRLAQAGRSAGLAVHVVHYRCGGWNGSSAHPVEDARWAADEAVRRYGDVPVSLVGSGLGARAALRAADHPAVGSVVALSPWLPKPAAAPGEEAEPVKQLIGRHVLLVHGTNDRRTHPELSYHLAERAKKVNRDVCRFEAHTDGHSLAQHRSEVIALTTDFVLGTLFDHVFSRPVTDALAAPPPLGLRMPLAAGFGTALNT